MTTCPTSQHPKEPSLTSIRQRLMLGTAVFALVLLAAVSARAQQPGVGVRVGVSAEPDQFYFGAHFDTGPLFDRLSFRPNAEIGVGDNRVTVAGNFEFAYWWRIPSHPWEIYAGGGPAVNVYDYSQEHGGGTDVKPGFNILLGLAHRGGFFTEIKVGLIDSPEFKFGIGYTWR